MGGETVSVYLVLLTLFASPGTYAALMPSEPFSGSASLVKDNVYHLFWKSDNTSITFEIHAKVKGWVGFGLSPTGGMAYSDIIIGWVKNGIPYFKDRWATGEAMPAIDSSQDWVLLAARETDTHTILKFKRPLYSCDPQDRNITEDTMRIIFAYSDKDPSSDNAVLYHGATRGVKSIALLTQHSDPPNLPPDAFYQDVVNDNITIPNNSDTTYWCSGHQPVNLTKKHHLLKITPVITPGNEAFVHHIVLHACYHEPSAKENTTSSAVCGTRNMPRECQTTISGWAVGGGEIIFPAHAGLPFGAEEERIFYLELEIHYDNPSLMQGVVDSSGLRLWFSPTLRTYDSSSIVLGMPTIPSLFILPAGYQKLISVGHCSEECLDQGMGNHSEIKVFSTFLHTHLLGVGVKIRHFRKGIELPYLDSDQHYDFNFQAERQKSPEIVIKKGDSLTVECTYNTKDNNATTFAGIKTRNEMCLAYLGVYPKVDLNLCLSAPTQAQMASHLSLKFRLNSIGNAILTEGPHANKSFAEYMKDIARFPDAATMNKYQEAIITGKTIQICRGTSTHRFPADFTLLDIPEVISPYTPEDKSCSLVGNTTGGSYPQDTVGRASCLISFGVTSLLLVTLVPKIC